MSSEKFSDIVLDKIRDYVLEKQKIINENRIILKKQIKDFENKLNNGNKVEQLFMALEYSVQDKRISEYKKICDDFRYYSLLFKKYEQKIKNTIYVNDMSFINTIISDENDEISILLNEFKIDIKTNQTDDTKNMQKENISFSTYEKYLEKFKQQKIDEAEFKAWIATVYPEKIGIKKGFFYKTEIIEDGIKKIQSNILVSLKEEFGGFVGNDKFVIT